VTAVVEDRRVRKTKAALQQAMVELVVEQGFESISIDALAGRADVTRATFYAHYPSKSALLSAVVDAFADDVIAALQASEVTSGPARRLEVLLEQAQASRHVLGLIVRGEGDGRPLRRFTERVEAVIAADLAARMEEHEATPRIDPSLIARLRAAQVVAAVAWFLDHDDLRPADLAEAVNLANERGWDWAAGVAPD
jgi:AcrR family transcriptional regulator